MKNIIIFTLLLSAFPMLQAQDFAKYEPLVCSGKIPDEFLTPSTKKYKAEIKKMEGKSYGRRERKDRKQFVLESSFVIDNLLQSGLVLYNDPISSYLNEVSAKLTTADPTFKKKVNVYVLRSAAVNAFATDRGTVFVTFGLLAQIENEAQLAYIISHELTHVQEGHNADLYLEAKDIERNKFTRRSVMDKATFNDALISKNHYSKELENQADKKGIERFLKTDYSTATLSRVFDVLKYAYLPWDEIKFEKGIFESNGYAFPTDYWLEKVNAISGEDEAKDDKKSTHPNIAARRKGLEEALEKAKPKAGKEFLISEDRFMKMRETARFELPMLHLHNGQYADAIYAAHLLLQKYPDNPYLQNCIAKALYYDAKYKNLSSGGDFSDGDVEYLEDKDEEQIEGEMHQVYNLMEKLDGKETTILAQRYAWLLQEKRPDDKEIALITEDLNIELSNYFDNLDLFSNPTSVAPAAPAPDDTEEKTKEGSSKKEKSKVDKIKEKKSAPNATDKTQEYWRTAFNGFVKEEKFINAFKKGNEEFDKRKKRMDYYESKEGKTAYAKELKKERKKGQRLGIPKIVIVNPFYLKLDARRDNAVQYVQSETGQAHLRDLYEKVSKKSKMKINILDVADLKESDADRFNEIRMLNDWYAEQVDFDNLTLTPGVSQEKINSIATKYGTDYFLWTGVISLREKKQGVGLSIAAGILLYPLLPFAIYNAAKPEYDMLYYAILFDVRTGRRKTVKLEYFDKRDTDTLLKAHFYDTLVQIKTDSKD